MTDPEASSEAPGARLGDYVVLALVCATAALAAAVAVSLVPLYVGSTVFPISVLIAMATTYALPRLGMWLTRRLGGGVLPLISWLVVVLVLGFFPRADGDVVIQGGNNEQWVAFGLIIGGAVVGFATVMRAGVNL